MGIVVNLDVTERLRACMDAEMEWVKRHDLQIIPFPVGMEDILDIIAWHIEHNLCGGHEEWASCVKQGLSDMIQRPDVKPPIPLDDPEFDPRVANFLKAFLNA